MIHIKWLANMLVHAGGQAVIAVCHHCIGSQTNHWQLRQLQNLADMAGGGMAIHHGQLDVH